MTLGDEATSRIAFGPVPSRRLGRSLGVNNIPPKICTYSCVYCQVGNTADMEVSRRPFYEPADILRATKSKYDAAIGQGEGIDYITFVPDGEPTLDGRLGETIDLLHSIGAEIGVISNASLISQQSTRDDLARADWVSLKVDAVNEKTWRKINRPHVKLRLLSIQEGMIEFANAFRGQLVTETMLVRGMNDTAKQVTEVAAFIARLQPAISYLSVPTRPPAETWVQIPDMDTLSNAYHILMEQADTVEFLIEYEGNEFAYTGNVEEDLLSIVSVHPMRQDAVDDFLRKAGATGSLIAALLHRRRLVKLEHGGHTFYMASIPGARASDEEKNER